MTSALPENFFQTKEEMAGQPTPKKEAPKELPENFFLSAQEVANVNRAAVLQEDIPTDPTLLPESPEAPQAHEAPIYGIDYNLEDIVTEEAQRFAQSYGPLREAQNWIGDIASVKGSMEGYKAGQKIAEAVKHPAGKLAVIAATSAINTGLHQFAGEILEQNIKGEELDYRDAFGKSVESASWDAGGNLILGGIGVISRKVIQNSNIELKDAKKAAQELFEKYGTTLTRYQMTGSTFARAAETISTLGIDFMSSVRKVTEKQQAALASEIDNIMTTGTRSEMGARIAGVHGEALKNIRTEYGATLKAITQAAPNVNINMKGFNTYFAGVRKRAAGIQDPKKAVETNEFKGRVNSILSNASDKATFEQIGTTISTLSEIQRSAKKAGDAAGEQYAIQMRDKLESLMDGASTSLGSNYKKQYDELRSWYSGSINKLNSEVMFKAMRKEPSVMGDFLVRNPESIKDFKKFIGEALNRGVITRKDVPEMMNSVRSGYVNSLIPTDPTFGEILSLGKKLRTKKTKENAKAVLGAPMYSRLEKILETTDLVKDHIDPNTRFSLVFAGRTSTAIQTVAQTAKGMVTGGAVVGAGSMSLTGAMTLLLAPTVLGKIAASGKNVRQWESTLKFLDRAAKIGDDEITRVALSRATHFMSQLGEEEGEE